LAQILLLDALNVPSPAQLVADVRSAGARGCFAYVWRPGGIADWSKAHVDALRGAGMISAPIIVAPGSGMPDPSAGVSAAKAFGFTGGPIFADMEGPHNLPPDTWWRKYLAECLLAGFQPWKYGNASDVGGSSYPNASGWWLADYLRQGSIDPPPPLPAGRRLWQYVDEVQIAGTTYDVSVADPEVFAAPAPQPLPLEDDMYLVHGPDGGDYLIYGPYCTILDPAQRDAYGSLPGINIVPGTITAARLAAFKSMPKPPVALSGTLTGSISGSVK
jgi:hypothetical protein